MLILALDTSSSSGSIALVRDNCVVAETSSDNVGTHSQWLMPSIAAIMEKTGTNPDEIGAVAVSMGPGSFTGLRIGISIAKGIAWTLGCKIVGISTLRALALNAKDSTAVAVPLLDARRGEVYSAIYSVKDGCTSILPDSAITFDALAEKIVRLKYQKGLLFTGDGLKAYKDSVVDTFGHSAVAPPELWQVRAATIAELAFGEIDSGNRGTDPVDFLPFYLRRSEAEIKLKKRDKEL